MTLVLVLVAILASWLAPYPYDAPHYEAAWSPPTRRFLFGTDHIGRDILSRVIFGSRVSLAVAISSTVLSMAIGVPVGLIAGYGTKVTDLAVMRTVDIVLAFPSLLLMILLAVAIGTGVGSMILAIGLTRWAPLARVIRGEALRIRTTEYVLAARALGATDVRILVKHILPNATSVIIVFATLAIPFAIMSEAGLGFIGIGVQPPTPSWGVLLNRGFNSFRSFPNVVLSPGAAIALSMLAFTLLGNGLRDILDPRTVGSGK